MNLTLENILSKLIRESVSNGQVLDAIDNRYYVRIKYDDGKDGNKNNSKGVRIIQPVAFGTTKSGYPVIRAFQINGNSLRGAPNWKFFRLDRIKSWYPMKRKKAYNLPDEKYGKYNHYGDKTMGIFVKNASFNKDLSDLEKIKQTTQSIVNAPKMTTSNNKGPITASQQWKKNVYTSQPHSKKYAQFAKNVTDTRNKTQNYWADYDKALQQANTHGPIPDTTNEYDVDDVDFNENNFIKNTNTRHYGK